MGCLKEKLHQPNTVISKIQQVIQVGWWAFVFSKNGPMMQAGIEKRRMMVRAFSQTLRCWTVLVVSSNINVHIDRCHMMSPFPSISGCMNQTQNVLFGDQSIQSNTDYVTVQKIEVSNVFERRWHDSENSPRKTFPSNPFKHKPQNRTLKLIQQNAKGPHFAIHILHHDFELCCWPPTWYDSLTYALPAHQ